MSNTEKSRDLSNDTEKNYPQHPELGYLGRRMLAELDTPTDWEQIKADVQRMRELTAQQEQK